MKRTTTFPWPEVTFDEWMGRKAFGPSWKTRDISSLGAQLCQTDPTTEHLSSPMPLLPPMFHLSFHEYTAINRGYCSVLTPTLGPVRKRRLQHEEGSSKRRTRVLTARAMLGAVSWRRCRGSGVHHLGMPVILLVVLLGSALLVREKGLLQRVISLPGQSSPDRGLSLRSAKLGASSAADGNQRQSLRRLGFRGGSSRQAQASNPHSFE